MYLQCGFWHSSSIDKTFPLTKSRLRPPFFYPLLRKKYALRGVPMQNRSIVVIATQLPLRNFGHKCIKRLSAVGRRSRRDAPFVYLHRSLSELSSSVTVKYGSVSVACPRPRGKGSKERAIACRLGLRPLRSPRFSLPNKQQIDSVRGLVSPFPFFISLEAFHGRLAARAEQRIS